jgi:hypothetical protein
MLCHAPIETTQVLCHAPIETTQVLCLPEGDPELTGGLPAPTPSPANAPVVVVGDSGSGKTALVAMAFAQVCACVRVCVCAWGGGGPRLSTAVELRWGRSRPSTRPHVSDGSCAIVFPALVWAMCALGGSGQARRLCPAADATMICRFVSVTPASSSGECVGPGRLLVGLMCVMTRPLDGPWVMPLDLDTVTH